MNLEGKISLIKSAVQSIKQAIIGKGQTPSGNLTTYATAIDNIVTTNNQNKTVTQNGVVRCDVGYTGLGDVTVNVDIPIGVTREIASGVYQIPQSSFTFSLPDTATNLGFSALKEDFYESKCTSADLSSLISISGDNALNLTFFSNLNLTEVDLSNLETVSGSRALLQTFNECVNLTDIDLSSLTTISGYRALESTFMECLNLITIDLSSLTTVSGELGLNAIFSGCKKLTTVDLSSLTTISGRLAMQSAFQGCTSLTTLSFPALTSTSFGSYTNQFNSMLSGVTGCTVHFPSNLQSVIGNWSSVTAGFGGTNTTVLFDLSATT